jgi:hypothetical protein
MSKHQFSPTEESPVALHWSSIEAQLGFLKGKILTVVDAAIADPQQNKAMKDLVHQQFGEQLNHIFTICWDGAPRMSVGAAPKGR